MPSEPKNSARSLSKSSPSEPPLCGISALRSPYGQGLAEYLIIVILVAVGIIVGLRWYGVSLFGQFHNATDQISSISQRDKVLPERDVTSESSTPPVAQKGGGEGDKAEFAKNSPATNEASSQAVTGRGTEQDLDKKIASLTVPVGDGQSPLVEKIQIDWSTLALFATGVVGLGIFVVFRRSGKRKNKERNSIFHSANGQGENGQVLVLGLFVCVGLFLVAMTVANVGMLVAEKIKLQDTVDASAYSAAVAEARYMNLAAYLNRTMIANYDTMAFNTALWSVADADDHGLAVIVSLLYKVDAALILFPFTTGFGLDLNDVINVIRDDVHHPLHQLNHQLNEWFAQDDDSSNINGLIETYNTDILSTYQGLMYAAMQASRYEVIRNVASKMDSKVVTTSVLGLAAEAVSYDELAKAVDWVVRDPNAWSEPFRSFQDSFNDMAGTPQDEDETPYLLAATTEASLNQFSAGRDRDGHKDNLRNFDFGHIIDFGVLEKALDIECDIEETARAASPLAFFTDPLDCNADINFILGAEMRDGYEDTAEQQHVPFIARKRMREVNFMGVNFRATGIDGVLGSKVMDLLDDFIGERGHTSGEKHNDVGNVANTTFSFSEGIDFTRAFESFQYNGSRDCAVGLPAPSCGLNSMNIQEAMTMLPNLTPPIAPPLFVDDHWDGTFDGIEPVSSYQLIPPIAGNITAVRYGIAVATDGAEDGVPKYDWEMDLDNVGFPNYIYPADGAEIRPKGTSGGENNNLLTGPSIAVVGTKEANVVHNLQGLGIGNPYSLSAIARSQVYYLRNPNRPDELPSLFNPHWVARLAPLDSEDTPDLLKEGLPFVASVGVPLTPTH